MIACSACRCTAALVLYFYVKERTVFVLCQNVQLQIMSEQIFQLLLRRSLYHLYLIIL